MTILKCAVVLLMVMGLTGCPKPDRGYVQREWSLSLRELGITPIFPPREDVVVGDVYAYRYDPNSDVTRRIFESPWKMLTQPEIQLRLEMGMSPRTARLAQDFGAKILEEYRATLSAPPTMAEYNSILGNPALAAANDQVEADEAKLMELQDKVAAARKAESDAQKDVLDATREKENKESAVKIAEGKLNKAKTTPPDTRVQEDLLKAAKDDLRLKEDAVTRADRALADAGADQGKKDQATKDKTQADRDKADAGLAVQRAQENLTAAKAVQADVSNLESDLTSAKNELQAAVDNLTKLTRIKEDKSAAAAITVQEQVSPIEKATNAVTAAKAVRDAIAKAGVKMLYTQPRDTKSDVYTGSVLPNPTSGADDMMNSRVNRLRLVAFPDFATTTFTQGDLAALIPVEAIMVGLNISSSSVAKVSVKVPAAESYALSLDKVVDLIAQRNIVAGKDEWEMKPLLNNAINAMRFQLYNKKAKDSKSAGTSSEGVAYFRVVTEVYYARAMDITLFAASSFGARVQVAPPAPSVGDDTLPTVTQMPAAPLNSPSAGSTSATDMLTSMQNRLALSQTIPGGSVQVVSYSDQSIGLRRVFDRPIAIGLRGLVVAVDKDMKVLRVEIDSSGVSTLQ